ncbi:MAG: histone deacetylase [Gracilimonas sp.]|uniref:histone deacetylase family protein n=1 Tax=Gracilimonas sp. TaxID=1974203 RepID=UPI003751F391|nr:histone deacetylase [Gracilimonas sp.]
MKKFSGLYSYLIDTGIVSKSEVIKPSLVDFSNLITVHTERYAKAVWTRDLNKKEIRRMGLPWSKSLAVRSRLAVQGTINAGLMALQDGLSGNLAGGTHHSMPDHGEGFCVYNDVAVAIKVLQQSMWVNRVLVVDCDVHQGNGTAYIFQDDPSVFTFSIHGEKNYPFKKPPSNLDVGLLDKTGDKEYHKTLISALDKIQAEFEPDLVFYLGGIDPLETDYFGRLSLTLAGLRERDRMVVEHFPQKEYPLVLLLSGGYAPTLKETVIAHAQMYEVAKEMGF